MTLKPATPSPLVEDIVRCVTLARRLEVARRRSMVVIALCCRCLHLLSLALFCNPAGTHESEGSDAILNSRASARTRCYDELQCGGLLLVS